MCDLLSGIGLISALGDHQEDLVNAACGISQNISCPVGTIQYVFHDKIGVLHVFGRW